MTYFHIKKNNSTYLYKIYNNKEYYKTGLNKGKLKSCIIGEAIRKYDWETGIGFKYEINKCRLLKIHKRKNKWIIKKGFGASSLFTPDSEIFEGFKKTEIHIGEYDWCN